MKTLQLNVETKIPILGLGTWQLTGGECVDGVAYALELGYTHIDTADGYGNHRQVTEGIKNSSVKRETFFITTKLAYPNGYTAAAVHADTDRFLEELETSYIDLLLIHWPNRNVPFEETLKAMDEVKKAGKIRAIGVSNFTPHHLDDALKAGVEITNDQVEVRPTFNQQALRDYCATKNITVTAYSSLRGGDTDLPLIQELAELYKKTPSQIIINWVVSRGMIAIPKSSKSPRIKENFESANFEMSETDLALIDALPQEGRVNNPSFGDFDY